MAFVAAVRRDEDVEPARYHEATEEDEQYDVADAEAEDMERVGFAVQGVAGGDEVRVGEGVYDGEDWSGYVFDQRTPEYRDIPILACADDDVQVAAKLLTLSCCIVSERSNI